MFTLSGQSHRPIVAQESQAAEISKRRVPAGKLQRKCFGEVLYLCAQYYVETVPDDDERREYLMGAWEATPTSHPDPHGGADAKEEMASGKKSLSTVLRVVREMQRVERVTGASILPQVWGLFGSFERKEGFREFVDLCRRPGGRDFVDEVLGFDESRSTSPHSSGSTTVDPHIMGENASRRPRQPKPATPDSTFFKKAPPAFPAELNFPNLLKLLTQQHSKSGGKRRGQGDDTPSLTPSQIEELLGGDEFTKSPRLAWPLQVLTLCTSFYLTSIKFGFDVVAGLFIRSATHTSGKGFLAALAVSAACSEVDAVVSELRGTGSEDLLATPGYNLSPPYLEEYKQAIQLRVCKALVRTTAKYTRLAALIGIFYEQQLDDGLGANLYGLVPVLRRALSKPPLSPRGEGAVESTGSNVKSSIETAGTVASYCQRLCTQQVPPGPTSLIQGSLPTPLAGGGGGGFSAFSNNSFGSRSAANASDDDDISSYNGGKSPLGSSMFSESSESTSNDGDSNGDATPGNQSRNQSLSSCPYEAAVAVAGSRAALKKRFFGTTQFAGLGIGDPAPAPANLMVTGAVVAMLVINTPVYVLRILVEECNSAHQWRSRNPFIPPPLPNAMRLGTARCRERLDRHLGPIGDVIPKAPVVVSRVFTSRTAEVCGHPADILRLEALLATLSGMHSGSKIHRDALPKAVPEFSPHFNDSMPLRLLAAMKECGLRLNKNDLAVQVNCPATGFPVAGDPNIFMYELAHTVTVKQQDLRKARLSMEIEVDNEVPFDFTFGLPGYNILLDFSPSRISIGKIASWEALGSIGMISMPDDTFHHPTSLLPPLKRSGREDVLRKTLRQLAILNTVMGSIDWHPADASRRSTLHAASLTTSFAELGLLIPADGIEVPGSVKEACKQPVSSLSGPGSPFGSDDLVPPLPQQHNTHTMRRSSASPHVVSPAVSQQPRKRAMSHHVPHTTVAPSTSGFTPSNDQHGGGTAEEKEEEMPDADHLSLTDVERVMLPFSTPWKNDSLHCSNMHLILGGVARYPPPSTAGGGAYGVPTYKDEILLTRAYAMPKFQDYRAAQDSSTSGLASPTSHSGKTSQSRTGRTYDLSDIVRIGGPCLEADILECNTKHFLSLAAVEVARRLSLVTSLDFPPHTLLMCWNVHGLLELWDVMLFRNTLIDTGTLLQ